MEAHLDDSQLAHLIVEKLEAHQAVDIVLLDLRELTPIADYFVICTADRIGRRGCCKRSWKSELKQEQKTRPLSTEGEAASGWILLDYNSRGGAHLLQASARFYRLEELWKAAPVVLKIQ